YSRSLIPGEQNRFGTYVQGHETANNKSLNEARADQEKIRAILEKGEDCLGKWRQGGNPCFIYGAGILGTFIANFLGGQVQGFIDDDPKNQGREVLEKPVVPFSALPTG